MSFKLSCPRCKAEPDDARLEVISGVFNARAMYLQEDGFATMDAKQFDTDEEKVYCHACEQTMSLGECLDDEVNDEPKQICPRCQQYLDSVGTCRVCQYPAPAPPGFTVEQWQAVEKHIDQAFGADEPDEQAVQAATARIGAAIDHILIDTNTPSAVLAAALRQLAKELG